MDETVRDTHRAMLQTHLPAACSLLMAFCCMLWSRSASPQALHRSKGKPQSLFGHERPLAALISLHVCVVKENSKKICVTASPSVSPGSAPAGRSLRAAWVALLFAREKTHMCFFHSSVGANAYDNCNVNLRRSKEGVMLTSEVLRAPAPLLSLEVMLQETAQHLEKPSHTVCHTPDDSIC